MYVPPLPTLLVISAGFLFALVILIKLLGKLKALRKQNSELSRRFAPVIDVEAEAERIRGDIRQARTALGELNTKYATAKAVFDRLQAEVGLLEENLEDISFGLYKPHFDYKTSEEFKAKLEEVRSSQKDLVRSGGAAVCLTAWTINNNRREGERMQKQYSKLLLRAFNGECDAAVAKVAWNNVTRMEARIKKAFAAINELGGVMQISLTQRYLDLALAELRLEHELEEKKQAEAEEQRAIRERMREEERVQRELERARREAEQDERRYERALADAKAKLLDAQGAEVNRLNDRIAELQEQLREAHEREERAISQAQLTRSGTVYVISNIGSFGENVFKIGMTRRLDPMDRIWELGDASVPFDFDVHAMIRSDDAPALEAALHQHFAHKRVNLVNAKKEFFSITIEEIAEFAKARSLKAEITKLAEAKEYRETLATRLQRTKPAAAAAGIAKESGFPESLVPEIA